MEVKELARVLAREIVMEYSSSKNMDNAADTVANIIEKVVRSEVAFSAVELQAINTRNVLAKERAVQLMKHYLAFGVRADGCEWDTDNDAEAREIVECIIAAVGVCLCNR